jgi:group I intron endonuclease
MNKINNKVYVGQTVQPINIRMRNHKNRNTLIGNAIAKYGIDNFIISENEVPEYMLDNLESNLIKLYNSISPNGYNLESGGHKNKHLSEETKRKMSNTKMGHVVSEESKKKMSLSKSGDRAPMFGKHWSDEIKKKMSESRAGEKHPLYGKHHSEETKKKMSESRKGRFIGKNNYMFGRKASEETKKKMSESRLAYLSGSGKGAPN